MITAPVSRILAVADLGRSIAFYRDVLGFTTRENVVESGAARIELVTGDSAVDSTGERRPRGAELLARGANVQGELISQPWGLRDFRVLDLEGNRITLGQPFE